MQYDNTTQKYINTRIYAQWNEPNETKPNPENCKNCSSKCAYDYAQLSVHNTAQNSSDNLPSYLQTITIAQMLSIRGEGESFNPMYTWAFITAANESGNHGNALRYYGTGNNNIVSSKIFKRAPVAHALTTCI